MSGSVGDLLRAWRPLAGNTQNRGEILLQSQLKEEKPKRRVLMTCRLCGFNFKVKFGNFEKSARYISTENLFKPSGHAK